MNTKKERWFFDLDNVVFDYAGAHARALAENPKMPYPQSQYGFFAGLEPLPGSVEVIKAYAANGHDVWFLSAPSERNPMSYTEKAVSIAKHFGKEWVSRLIICSDKSLLIGDVLVDDYAVGKGQDKFQGKLIHFGSSSCPDWTHFNPAGIIQPYNNPTTFDRTVVVLPVTNQKVEFWMARKPVRTVNGVLPFLDILLMPSPLIEQSPATFVKFSDKCNITEALASKHHVLISNQTTTYGFVLDSYYGQPGILVALILLWVTATLPISGIHTVTLCLNGKVTQNLFSLDSELENFIRNGGRLIE